MPHPSPIQHFLAHPHSPSPARPGRNTYLSITPTHGHGLPVSLKDCFDLAGTITTCGSLYYAQHRAPAAQDSAVAARLKAFGATITGKTHMHQLAYGITGENADYGDCLQPDDPTALTGGSSSGAAASVQEGSALAAVGTDTGGSIRVPAALCGLAGYRSSHGLTDWRGAHHLASSFDTAGWLFRDLRDAPLLARILWDASPVPLIQSPTIGLPPPSMLDNCEPSILAAYRHWQHRLVHSGATLTQLNLDYWQESYAIFAPIQAHEASRIHSGLYQHFEPAIADRLTWGASLPLDAINALRLRHLLFKQRTSNLFQQCDFILMPATPIAKLIAGADHSAARQVILRYTTPASVAGLPVLTLPDGGMQLIAAQHNDAALLAYSAHLGDLLAAGL